MTDEPDPAGADHPRRVLLVPGPEGSGANVLAGIVELLGLDAPDSVTGPERLAEEGAASTRWAADLHDRLLAEAGVDVDDARPVAWFETGQLVARNAERAQVADWLERHLGDRPELLVRDRGLGWFLGLWEVACLRAGATPVSAVVLRAPEEVVATRLRHGPAGQGPVPLAARWLNAVLHTERATRDRAGEGRRAFVSYSDLLEDWPRVVKGVGDTLQLQRVIHAKVPPVREVHRLVPALERVDAELGGLGLPARLRELVEEAWRGLSVLVDPAADAGPAWDALDQVREAWVDLYTESEAIAESSAEAAAVRARREAARHEPSASRARRTARRVRDRARGALQGRR